MVIKTSEKTECGCGAMIGTRGQLMHETSKAHRAWLEASQALNDRHNAIISESLPILEPMDATLVAALDAARRGDSPYAVAKMIRSVFTRMEWPNEEHPSTQADFHKEHNIPSIDLPPHADPSTAREFISRSLDAIKAQGWGTPRWEIT